MDKLEIKKYHDLKKKSLTKETLFDEILLQNTYTDIVDLILKYTKSIKGQPSDLVNLLDYLKDRLLKHLHEFVEVMEIDDPHKESEQI